MPQLGWSSQDADTQASAAGRAGSAALVQLPAGSAVAEADAFGSAARGGARLAPLLLRSAAVEQLGPYHLFPQPRGSLNSLAALPVDASRTVGSNDVLVAVKAVGINVRDVLNVLGMYPGDPGAPGGDCAGVVLRGRIMHGSRVIAGPGDAVFGLAMGSLGSHVVASSQTVVPMPPSVRWVGACLPMHIEQLLTTLLC